MLYRAGGFDGASWEQRDSWWSEEAVGVRDLCPDRCYV